MWILLKRLEYRFFVDLHCYGICFVLFCFVVNKDFLIPDSWSIYYAIRWFTSMNWQIQEWFHTARLKSPFRDRMVSCIIPSLIMVPHDNSYCSHEWHQRATCYNHIIITIRRIWPVDYDRGKGHKIMGLLYFEVTGNIIHGTFFGDLRNVQFSKHYNDVIMSVMASQIIRLTIVYSTVYSRRRSQKTSKFRVSGLRAENSPVTGEFPAKRASYAENVSIWWRHHGGILGTLLLT